MMISAQTHVLADQPLIERIQETVLLSVEPLEATEVTARLYTDVNSNHLSRVYQALQELAGAGQLRCLQEGGREMAWAAAPAFGHD